MVAIWSIRSALRRSTCASTIAPTAAVISSAEVSSKAKTYLVNSSRAMPCTLPSAFASSSPAAGTPSSARYRPLPTRPAKPSPRTTAATRWPRSVSMSESEASRPTSISTNRNSIMIAPV